MGKRKTATTPKDKTEPVSAVRDRIRARYEKPVVIYETDADTTPVYQTRFPRLNQLLGGGIRAGSIVEMFGFQDSGKSSGSISLAADIQREAALKGKPTVVLCNYEGPQDYRWWRQLGLDTREDNEPPSFIQLRPKSLEEGIGDTYDLVKTGEVCVVIFDSVYAAESRDRKKMMANWSDSKAKGKGAALGVEAVKWGEAWTSLKGPFQDHGVVAIAVNQMRELINTSGPPRKGWGGKPVTTPRGHALKFYAWVRLKMESRALEDGQGNLRSDVDGRRIIMRVVKNKTSGDARGRAEYDLIRGFGFDTLGDLIDLALEAGAIKTKGGGYYTVGKRQIRGRQNLRDFVEGSEKVRTILSMIVTKYLKGGQDEEAQDDDQAQDDDG